MKIEITEEIGMEGDGQGRNHKAKFKRIENETLGALLFKEH